MFELYFVIPTLIILWWYSIKSWDREGINYNPFFDSSFPNPTYQLEGNRWSNNTVLKNIYKESKFNSLKFDNFDYPIAVKQKHISIFKIMLTKKAEVYISPSSLVESLVMLAPMKGGKTTTLMSWLAQDWYNRAIINEQKAGDFISKFYNKRKDIILCYFDKRAHVWDILSESIPIIEFYIINSLNSATKNESFFTSDAKKRYKQIAMLTLEYKEPKEKWKVFIHELEVMFKEIEESDSKSAKDVAATMTQILEPLKLTNFQLQNGKRSFTIKEFFRRKYQSKLFMLNIDEYAVSLKPLFTAFTACTAMVQASMKESKTDLTYYLLDEYLSLEMTYEARKILHTKTRSKGAVVVSAMQFLPEEKKIRDLLTSSAFAYMFFSIKNETSRDFINKQIGKREYLVRKKLNNQYKEETKTKDIIHWNEIDKLSKNFQHVTYIPETGSLYVGKSDYINFPQKHKLFVIDSLVHEFYIEENREFRNNQDKRNTTKLAAKKALLEIE